MSDALKRLLEAEQRAQQIVDDALEQQEQTLEQARLDAREAEQRFETSMHELRRNLDTRSEEEAASAIAQMERRYHERRQSLQELAEQHREDACEAAISIVIDPERL
jgi:vacuolar-type H+-ATPase subunit H